MLALMYMHVYYMYRGHYVLYNVLKHFCAAARKKCKPKTLQPQARCACVRLCVCNNEVYVSAFDV